MGKWTGLIIAVLVAVFAAFIVLQFSDSGRSAPPAPAAGMPGVMAQPSRNTEVETENVYVAAGYIPVGTRIQESMLDSQPWPKHLIVKGFVSGAESGKKLINQVTRAEFRKGEPFMASKLVNPSDPNFIAGALPKGMRLATLPTEAVSGLAGFVFPGDRVDVILTHEVTPEGAKNTRNSRYRIEKEEISEVLISNVKVMAVDQKAAVSTEGEIKVPKTVSIAVTPEDAQKLALGVQTGEVSLALRSINDKESFENIAVTRKTDLTQGGDSSQTEASTVYQPVIVVRGIEVEGDKEEQAAGGFNAPPRLQ